MGPLDRIEQRLNAAGIYTTRATVNAGIYADDLNQDHGERAEAVKIRLDRIFYQSYEAYIKDVHTVENITRKSRSTSANISHYYYPLMFSAWIITKADEDRLNAAEEERKIFMPVWERVYHETNDGKTAARAGREAVEAWKEEKTA